MAVPKRKMSRSRTRHRKAQWAKLKLADVRDLPPLQGADRPHTVCATCGTYAGAPWSRSTDIGHGQR
jgi:large subunit ribosomal protein L32